MSNRDIRAKATAIRERTDGMMTLFFSTCSHYSSIRCFRSDFGTGRYCFMGKHSCEKWCDKHYSLYFTWSVILL